MSGPIMYRFAHLINGVGSHVTNGGVNLKLSNELRIARERAKYAPSGMALEWVSSVVMIDSMVEATDSVV